DNTKEGKKREKKLANLADDLRLVRDQELLEAPDCPPVENYDLSYRDAFPWMYQPEQHLTVDEVIGWKEEKEDKEERPVKDNVRKLLFYDLKGEVAPEPDWKGKIFYAKD